MPIQLKKPVADYFAADRDDRDAVALCFTEDALVKDEGHVYQGRTAIAQWKAESSSKYQYTSTPLSVEQKGDGIIVTSCVAGNFPGSPVNLRYLFTLRDDKIVALEIVV